MNKRPKPGEDYDDVLNEQIKFLEKNKPSAPVVRLERGNNQNEKSNRKIEIENLFDEFYRFDKTKFLIAFSFR